MPPVFLVAAVPRLASTSTAAVTTAILVSFISKTPSVSFWGAD
jgi:hypothetical protein